MEGRVIPADRRGSCCFLLGIVTVTLHGASHAGITNKSSQSVLENHPVSSGKRARGRFRSRSLGKGGGERKGVKSLQFEVAARFVDLIAGSESIRGRKITRRFGQLLRPCPSKIIFLHFSHGRISKKNTMKSKFSAEKKKKSPLISRAVQKGVGGCYDTLLRLFTHAKKKKKTSKINKL